MHMHVRTDLTHGDVAGHNIVYATVKKSRSTRILANLVDFGNGGFKDVSVFGTQK